MIIFEEVKRVLQATRPTVKAGCFEQKMRLFKPILPVCIVESFGQSYACIEASPARGCGEEDKTKVLSSQEYLTDFLIITITFLNIILFISASAQKKRSTTPLQYLTKTVLPAIRLGHDMDNFKCIRLEFSNF